MNATQTISRDQVTRSDKMSLGSLMHLGSFGKSLTIEKSISLDWAYKLYKGSVIDAFWSVLSSPVN